MRTFTAEVIASEDIPALWNVFQSSWAPIVELAAQRHEFTLTEFVDMMTDKRVIKHITVTDDDRIAALSTLTSDLDSNHTISPQFYARRWPKAYAEGRVWIVGFVVVAPEFRRTDAFENLVTSMMSSARELGGVVALDVCQFNDEVVHIPDNLSAIGVKLNLPVERELIDVQKYYAWEFPTPA